MLSNKDNEWAVNTLKEGKKSEYWKILEGQIINWIKREQRIIKAYNKVGIHSSEDQDKFNRAIDRLEYLENNFLTINEDLITYNESLLKKVTDSAESFIKTTESFVEGLFK